jgi:hypothetical protein
MRETIPAALIALTAELASERETHATLDSLFSYAGASGDPPVGSKHAKAMEWLRATNKDPTSQPLKVLGKILEGYMDGPIDPTMWGYEVLAKFRPRISKALDDSSLIYVRGGLVSNRLGTPTRALADFIRDRDHDAIDLEFDRAVKNCSSSPREAISAASNLLETVCKIIIHDDGLAPPAKQDLQSVFGVVRKHLGLDPSKIEDQDLQQIISGLLSVAHGIGSLRTHASSAHGQGKNSYKVEPRHARLAVHASHTLALYLLESWVKRGNG